MRKAEQIIAEIIKESGMTIRFVSKKTGIPYGKLQPSLSGKRELRADEYLKLCWLLQLDPRTTLEQEQKGA